MKPRIKVVKSAETLPAAHGPTYEAITLAEQVHRKLRADIVSGAIPPSQALRLEYLKRRYGISYSPLREALNRLHSEQLVVSTTSRGFRVAPFSETEMWDAIETRILIDCEALRRSLMHGDDAWETRLVAAFHALTLAARQRATDAQTRADSEGTLQQRHHDFHRSLLSACGSRWLLNLSEQLYTQTERYRQPSLRDRRYWSGTRNVAKEHQQLLDAALARNSAQATELLAQHYRATGHVLMHILGFAAT